jgi:hypothetical protein
MTTEISSNSLRRLIRFFVSAFHMSFMDTKKLEGFTRKREKKRRESRELTPQCRNI